MQPLVKKGTPFYVNMSNELIRSAHGLTLGEKRLLMLAIAKIDSKKPATPQNMVTRIDVSEFINEFKITPQTAYTEVRHAAEQLMNRYIRFFYPDKDGKEIETRMQWVGRASYKKSEGWVELAFWHELSPMLFELQERFTSYKLDRVGGLRSVYSWRLFELLMQFKSTGKLKISVDEFTQIMEAPKSIKANFANLRIKIIEPAVKEIREKDGLKVKWEPIKAGRKVQTLLFTFPQEQQVALPLKQPKQVKLTKAYIEKHAYPGESYIQATQRLSRRT
uniref:RepB family plasmid replication initiator protein n=1 Tax=uncultured Thiotrichaceae bacterium TaxID=298394 RepID=A0A6S6SVV0_9GAMM|nr:MAG: RepB family plasmid replication initiator protein [uncultured Thiotrichaceae bacterium]